jgi:hypothetical protein
MGMRFCGHIPNSSRNKNMKRAIPYLLEKNGFWAPKHYCPLHAQRKKPLLNVIVSQMVENECLRFGEYMNKLATRSYGKKYQKKLQFCTIHLTFIKGYFEAILTKKNPLSFRN